MIEYVIAIGVGLGIGYVIGLEHGISTGIERMMQARKVFENELKKKEKNECGCLNEEESLRLVRKMRETENRKPNKREKEMAKDIMKRKGEK